jgi:hypothetical protein
VLGRAPPPRFRHATVHVQPPLGSPLRGQLAAELPGGLLVEQGDVLLLTCGSSRGEQLHGGELLPVLWVSHDGAQVLWSQCSTTGDVPGPRAHHTASACCGGRRVVLFGFGADEAVPEPEAPPAVYCLDMGSLEWSRRETFAASPADHPGWRLLHMAVVHSRPGGGAGAVAAPGGLQAAGASASASASSSSSSSSSSLGSQARLSSGHAGPMAESSGNGSAESQALAPPAAAAAAAAAPTAAAGAAGEELVVVGGTVLGALVEMVPCALCLATWTWRRSPGGGPGQA